MSEANTPLISIVIGRSDSPDEQRGASDRRLFRTDESEQHYRDLRSCRLPYLVVYRFDGLEYASKTNIPGVSEAEWRRRGASSRNRRRRPSV